MTMPLHASKGSYIAPSSALPPPPPPTAAIVYGPTFGSWTPTEDCYFPQQIPYLRARFHHAINHVHYCYEDIRRPQKEWAAADRNHVFDFEDGMRLIVSLDAENRVEKITAIHVSASIRQNSDLAIITPLRSVDEWQTHIISHLEEISNFIGEVADRWISDPPKRVLHLWFKEIR